MGSTIVKAVGLSCTTSLTIRQAGWGRLQWKEAKTTMKIMTCPSCGTQMRPVPVVWKQGTSVGGSSTFGLGYAGGDLVPFAAGTSSQTQNRFAAELGPPEPRGLGSGSVLLVVLSIIAVLSTSVVLAVSIMLAVGIERGGNVLSLVLLPVLIAFVFVFFIGRTWWKNRIWNNTVWPKEYEEWENGQICINCGYWPVAPRLRAAESEHAPYVDQFAPPAQRPQPHVRAMPTPPPPPPSYR